MSKIGVIGGSGLGKIENLDVTHREMVNTPYGSPSCPVAFGGMGDEEIIFIPRHGIGHTISPHEINYRANIYAMKQLGVAHVIAINAVGGITDNMTPVKLVFPHQIIDYTYSRKHTFYDKNAESVVHIDFSYPYDERLRKILAESARKLSIDYETEAIYGATQGPRLETAAEIERLERDGCDIVGMTGMPEAALAREMKMSYASCSVVVNKAAGKSDGAIVSMQEIDANLKSGMQTVSQLLATALPQLSKL